LIARGQDAAAEILCESDDWVAFFPLRPATPGHTLVIPRVHVADLWDAPPALASELMTGVVRLGRAIQSALAPEGMNLISSSGAIAEQTVYHLHLHVVPRWRNDGFGHIWPPKHESPATDLREIAQRIRAACP